MAERIFSNVRLGLKVDSLENWSNSSLVLKKGEVAFATVAASAGVGLTEPVCMMKIGDGEHTFSELDFDFYAKASDVIAQAKSAESLTAFINGVIADAGIASDEAMQELAGNVSVAEGKIATLEGEMDAVEAKAAANETAIAELEEEMAKQITAAIEALADVYAGKALETTVADHVADTVAHVTADDKIKWNNALQTADVATGSANGTISVKGSDVAVKGLGSAAYTDSTAYDPSGSAAQALIDAKDYADGKDADIAAAKKAGEDAAAAVDGKLTTEVERAKAAEAKALEDAQKYTDDEIKEWVGESTVPAQISAAIADYTTTADMNTAIATAKGEAVSHANSLNTAMNTRVEALEAIDHEHTFVEAELNKIAEGDVAKWNAAEQNAKDYADGLDGAMDTRVKALEDKFTGEGSVADQIADAVADETGLREAADAELQKAIDAIEEDYLTSVEEKALQDQIDAIDAVIGDVESIATYVDGAVKAEADRAKGVEGGLETRLKAVEDDYLKAADKTELTNAIATAKQEAVATVLGEGTDEDFDTLKEVADWILSDTTGAAALQTDVATIKADYLKAADKTELEGKLTAAQNAANAAQGEVDALEGVVATKAAQADLEALDDRVEVIETELNTETTGLKARMTAAEGEIDDIQTVIGEVESVAGYVAEEISAAIAAENLSQYALAADLDTAEGKIEALEADTHTHANAEELAKFADGDKAKLDAAVQTVTPGTGLTATKTGTDIAIDFDENVTFIFDCGTSAE